MMWVPQVTESVFTECVTPALADTSTGPFPVIDYVEIEPPCTAPACMTEHQDLLCRQPDTKTCSAGSRIHMFTMANSGTGPWV